MRAAVERRDPEGRSANPAPEEVLTAEDAVQLYTVGGGSALGERGRGSLEEGADADLVVLATTGLSEALRAGARSVEETWVDGRRVYRRAGVGGTVKP